MHFPSYVNPFLGYGHKLTCAAPVRILVAPANVEEDTNSHTHTTLALSCVAMGTPRPHITWERNNHPIRSNSLQFIHEATQTRLGLEMVVSTLVICPQRAEGGGEYLCRAENSYSSAEASFTVPTIPGERILDTILFSMAVCI